MANFPPWFNASQVTSATTAALTAGTPAVEELDISVLLVVTANHPIVLSSAFGYTEFSGGASPQGTGTAGAADAVRLAAFWRRETSSSGLGNPIVALNGDFIQALIITIRGAVRTGNPIVNPVGAVLAAPSTSFSIPGSSTTVPFCRVFNVVAHSTDTSAAEASGWTNADLTSIAEHNDHSTLNGSGGGLAVASGIKAAAGAYGATTGNLVTSSVQALLTFGVLPQVSDYDANVVNVTIISGATAASNGGARGMTTPVRMAPFSPTRGAQVLYAQKELLKSAGWIITSGDGLSAYTGTTDVITHNGSGAGGADNARSWFRARQPTAVNGIRKEFCQQLVTASSQGASAFRIKFSPSSGFVTGSPSANTVPTAADQMVLFGNSGTDATPTGAAGWVSTNAALEIGIADSVAPHGFVFWQIDLSGVDNDFAAGHRWILDPLISPNHSDVQDPDKYVVHVTAGGSGNDPWQPSGISSNVNVSATGDPGWGRSHNGTWERYSLQAYKSVNSSSSDLVLTNPPPLLDGWSGKALLVPGIYLSETSGVKGISTMLHWIQGPITSSANNYTFSCEGENNAYIKRQGVVIPWGGSPPGDLFQVADAVHFDFPSPEVEPEPLDPATLSGLDPVASSAISATDNVTFTLLTPGGRTHMGVTVTYGSDYVDGEKVVTIFEGPSGGPEPGFTVNSIINPTAGSTTFNILPDSGVWPSTSLTFDTIVIDLDGTVFQESWSYTTDFVPVAVSSVRYRMRARDTTLGRTVYWTSSVIDGAGDDYTGPGPLTDIVVSELTGLGV